MAFKAMLVVLAVCLISMASGFVAPASFVRSAAAKQAVHMGASTNFAAAAAAAVPTVAAFTLGAPGTSFAAEQIDAVAQLPTQLLSLEVQFGAYLAVLLGTLLPTLFLVLLYSQSEARKGGVAEGEGK